MCVLIRAIYVLHELSLFAGVPREAGVLSSSCHSWEGLIFPKLFKDTGQSALRPEGWGQAGWGHGEHSLH